MLRDKVVDEVRIIKVMAVVVGEVEVMKNVMM